MKKVTDVLDIDDQALAQRVNALIERGLERYGDGDLVGALSEWEHALALYPDAAPALQYIQYVRDNFQLLEDQFDEAKRAAAVAAEAGLPIEEVGVGEEEDDEAYAEISLESDYDAIEVDYGPAGEDTHSDARAETLPVIDGLELDGGLDEGWALDELPTAAPLPPTPEEFYSPGLDVVDPVAGVSEGEIGDGRAELAADQALRGGLGAIGGFADIRGADDIDEVDEIGGLELALEGPEPDYGAEPDGDGESDEDAGESHDDAEPTQSHRPSHEDMRLQQTSIARDVISDEEITVPGGDEPPPLPDRLELSHDALAELDAAVDEELARLPAASDPPAGDAPAAFDLGELDPLDRASRDDRVSDSEAGPDVRVTFHEVGTSEKTVPARPSVRGARELDLELGDAGSSLGLGDDDMTRERDHWAQRAPTRDPALSVIIDDSLLTPDSSADDDATRELLAISDDVLPPEEEEDRDGDDDDDDGIEDGTQEFDAHSRSPITGVLRPPSEVDAVSMEVVAAQIAAEVDAKTPDGAPEPERIRHRIDALLDRAEQEHAAGHFPLAIAAVDLALEEAPDSAVAQKIIHGRRDLLFKVFEAYIGDEKSVPMVALPAHEIAQQQLDSRAAFLLSRIDGMLTFEDVLDVAGMSRLEAYRHLCRLLLRGVLEVR